MKDFLNIHLYKFLRKYCLPHSSPILLALSGGPDSLALLHLLMQHRQMNPTFSFAVAHIDHRWREESSEEALSLEKKILALSIPFHLKTLNPETITGNLEAACREERLKFFVELCLKHKYTGVLTGHHADDVAETVLKRIFEGASLPYLSGIREETKIYGIKVWRPLLTIRKKQIESWLESHGETGFIDSTNNNPKFMRGRLRTRIIPELNQEFGKDITSALCHLSEESAELHEYLDEQIAPFMEKVQQDHLEVYLDLKNFRPKSRFETKYLIRRFCETHAMPLSREALNIATTLFLEGTNGKRICFLDDYLYIDRFRLCLKVNRDI